MSNLKIWNERRSGLKIKTIRNQYDHDYARILHSSHFRRLQGKTQVYLTTRNDFIRTRLTHSLEVAQIAYGLLQSLQYKLKHVKNIFLEQNSQKVDYVVVEDLPAEDKHNIKSIMPPAPLISAIGIGHDLGHPPFGHSGEEALNKVMFNHGGFEGNAQTFRILTKIASYSEDYGLDLCRRTLLGIIKYPAYLDDTQLTQQELDDIKIKKSFNNGMYRPSKGIYSADKEAFEWVLSPLSENDRKEFTKIQSFNNNYYESSRKTLYKSFDCSIMELADDIAYGVHDLEDAIKLGLITREQFEVELNNFVGSDAIKIIFMKLGKNNNLDYLATLFNPRNKHTHKRSIGILVNYLIENSKFTKYSVFEEYLLRYNVILESDTRHLLNLLKHVVSKYVINSQEIHLERHVGMMMIEKVTQVFINEPSLLPEAHRDENDCESSKFYRNVSDYISGMSNKYITDLYHRIFMP